MSDNNKKGLWDFLSESKGFLKFLVLLIIVLIFVLIASGRFEEIDLKNKKIRTRDGSDLINSIRENRNKEKLDAEDYCTYKVDLVKIYEISNHLNLLEVYSSTLKEKKVVCVVKKDELIKIIDDKDPKYFEVTIQCNGGKSVEGYIMKCINKKPTIVSIVETKKDIVIIDDEIKEVRKENLCE